MLDLAKVNIDRFKFLLKVETDPIKRAMVLRRLAEENAKLDGKTPVDEAQPAIPRHSEESPR